MATASRRGFIKSAAIAGSSIILLPDYLNSSPLTAPVAELYSLCEQLVGTWGDELLRLQVTDSASDNYGGILSPDNKLVPGRCADAIYPFFYIAHQKKDQRYQDAAMLLYKWMEHTVSQPDGSWLNEPVKGSWKGITVFTATALAETLKLYATDMSPDFKSALEQRLQKAGEYIRNNFTMDYGNINYPISATYCLTLLGEVLNDESFTAKGKLLAQQAMQFITPKDGFIYGEGTPYYQASPKGCYGVDLGYNVEESLPALVMYAKLNNDQAMIDTITRSLYTHLEFMLPDGGWDNSWGTRNFKWTYWGSRTSDGCQPAYALMADKDPVFYRAALANTKLLKACTHNGLLYGGPHLASRKMPPSVHHTFCHIKALVTTLTHGNSLSRNKYPAVSLPRERSYDSRFFADIQTWLISKGKFRATVTGYDREYKETQGGHPTGGALSLLWHENTGPLLVASMNEYQLFEAGNMQPDTDPNAMPLTPRVELKIGNDVYMNIADLSSTIKDKRGEEDVMFETHSKLVDKNQLSPKIGEIRCKISYTFSAQKTILGFSYDEKATGPTPTVIIPLVCRSDEKVNMISSSVIEIKKANATLRISCNHDLIRLPTSNGRVFNFVPGLEAIPLAITQNNAIVQLEVIA